MVKDDYRYNHDILSSEVTATRFYNLGPHTCTLTHTLAHILSLSLSL